MTKFLYFRWAVYLQILKQMGQAFLSLPPSPHQSDTADLKSEVETWLRIWPRRKTILLIALNIFNFSLSYQLSVTSKGHIDLFHG